MVLATKVFNMLSGVIVMMTALYVEVAMQTLFSEVARSAFLALSAIYFLAQFYLHVLRLLPVAKPSNEASGGGQFSA